MLRINDFQLKIRGDPRPHSNVAIEIVYQDEPALTDMAQLIFVKSRAEAEKLAAKLKVSDTKRVVLLRNNDQVKFHHSKLSREDKSSALQSLAAGNSIATYGMAVGLNIMVKGEPVTSVDVVGTRHFVPVRNA